jgi:GDPmannose 4,6-dehydratase
MHKQTALITGITGQDGAYLAEFLLNKGYRVVGLWRKTSAVSPNNVSHLQNDIELMSGDLLDNACLVDAVQQYQPDELYNFASQSR